MCASSSRSRTSGFRSRARSRSNSRSITPRYSTARGASRSKPSARAAVGDSTVGFDPPDHHIGALGPLGARRLQHRVGLAHTGRGSEEDPEAAPCCTLGGGDPAKQRVRVGTLIVHLRTPILMASGSLRNQRLDQCAAAPACGSSPAPGLPNCSSRSRFRRSTLTRGSPRNPQVRGSTRRSRTASTSATATPLADATRGACQRAASGLTWGSSPLPDAVTSSTGIAPRRRGVLRTKPVEVCGDAIPQLLRSRPEVGAG